MKTATARPAIDLRKYGTWFVGTLLMLGMICEPAQGAYSGGYPYRIGATVGMAGDIARAVAGDRGDVELIIGAGVDPHVYKPTRGDVSTLRRADIIFYAGFFLEGQMANVLAKISRKRPVYAVIELLPDEYLIHDPATNHRDPHVWMDVSGWMKAVEAVADALVAFDPEYRADYRQNAEVYLQQLTALDDYARQVMASIPAKQRVLVTAHDAFNYMGRAYGIEVMGSQGLSTESEAGLKDINLIVGELVRRRIPAVFVESSVSDRNVKALIGGARSRKHIVRIGGELYSDAMGPSGSYEGSYIGMIDHNVTVIARALGGQAPPGGMQGRLRGEE